MGEWDIPDSLLSENDYRHLADALRRMEELELPRSMGPVSLVARTARAGKPWKVAMLVQVRIDTPRMTVLKNCESVDEFRNWMKQSGSGRRHEGTRGNAPK